MILKLIGYLRFLRFKRVYMRPILDSISMLVEELPDTRSKEKIFIAMFGFTHSGKTTFLNDHPELSQWFRVDKELISKLIKEHVWGLSKADTFKGSWLWTRTYMFRFVHSLLIKFAIINDISVVDDTCHLNRIKRQRILINMKEKGYKTVIIHVNCDERTLIGRLCKADKILAKSGQSVRWLKHWERFEKKDFNPPSKLEADRLIRFNAFTMKASDVVI